MEPSEVVKVSSEQTCAARSRVDVLVWNLSLSEAQCFFSYPLGHTFPEETAMKFRMLGVLLMSLLLRSDQPGKDVVQLREVTCPRDSVPFGYIEEADYEYYYPANFVSYSDT